MLYTDKNIGETYCAPFLGNGKLSLQITPDGAMNPSMRGVDCFVTAALSSSCSKLMRLHGILTRKASLQSPALRRSLTPSGLS